MLGILFTLDYEIHGNGEGSPRDLMVEPTNRMLSLFERYGARLTIMADIAEILKFKEYREKFGRDDYRYTEITRQLCEAIRRGHDVQLHIHSSYFNARYEKGRWVQDWSEYNFAGLDLRRLREFISIGKAFLESLLQPVDPDYKCNVFRAANWSMSPSNNVVRALVENGITIDTSVFKYGRRQGLVSFDYSNACSALVPWKVDEQDICAADEAGGLLEVPIYSEHRWLGAFLTPQRLHRAYGSRRHKFETRPRPNVLGASEPKPEQDCARGHWLTRRHAWKADFNQCSGRQLVGALKRAEARYGSSAVRLPFVLIGHSKLFTRLNGWSLRPFLAFIKAYPDRFWFARFGDFELGRQRTKESNARQVVITSATNGLI
jgi:hypothetical protein